MKSTSRFPKRSVRWISLLISLSLLTPVLFIVPIGVGARAPRNRKTIERNLNPPQSPSPRGRQPAPRDAGRRVDPIQPERGAPAFNFPSAEELKRRKPEK